MVNQSPLVAEALGVNAHPLWGRIIWRTLKQNEKLDIKELERRGVHIKSLWDADFSSYPFTYAQWFTLLEYAYEQLGPNCGIDLAVHALQHAAPYTETITATCPSARAWFHFWENFGSELDVTHQFRSKRLRGGMAFEIDYRMGGIIEEAFAMSCIAIIVNTLQTIVGSFVVQEFVVNFNMCRAKQQYAESVLPVRLKQGQGTGESFSFKVSDKVLDAPSIGDDPVRYSNALKYFEQLTQELRSEVPKLNLADVVASLQLTSDRPLSMEKCAERLGYGIENYRKKLSQCGTSHRQVVSECVRHRAEKMIQLGQSQYQIAEKMGITQQRLKRHLSGGP